MRRLRPRDSRQKSAMSLTHRGACGTAAWLRRPQRLPLNTRHNALDDCRTDRDVLIERVAPAR